MNHTGSLCDNTNGLIFMGTPFEGSNTTKWIDFFGKIAKLLPTSGINTTLTNHLKPDSHELKTLTEDFAEWLTNMDRRPDEKDKDKNKGKKIKVVCFSEEFPSQPGGLIVPRELARIGGHKVIPLPADHIGIYKFENFEDPKYKAILPVLQGWVEEIKKADAGAARRPEVLCMIFFFDLWNWGCALAD